MMDAGKGFRRFLRLVFSCGILFRKVYYCLMSKAAPRSGSLKALLPNGPPLLSQADYYREAETVTFVSLFFEMTL
jgi:hypothetical protein